MQARHLAGRYIGAGNRMEHYTVPSDSLFGWGVGLIQLGSPYSITVLVDKSFLGLLTNESSVIQEADTYFYWVLAIPTCRILPPFLWDGIFIGATATRQMLLLHVHRFCQFLLLPITSSQGVNGKSCLVDGFYYLPVASRHLYKQFLVEK